MVYGEADAGYWCNTSIEENHFIVRFLTSKQTSTVRQSADYKIKSGGSFREFLWLVPGFLVSGGDGSFSKNIGSHFD